MVVPRLNPDVCHDRIFEPVPPGVHVGDPEIVDERVWSGVDSSPLIAREVGGVVVRNGFAVAAAKNDGLRRFKALKQLNKFVRLETSR